RRYFTIAVCGTHGKTTTTAMIIQILRHCGFDPDFCVGGECAAWEGVAGIGAGRVLVIESDESDGTIGCYRPDVTVFT
ncbi:MAG: UDP-N-acetylmuramate--L-alanine ligase, partial [Kiritimatiellia bacterium]